MQKNILSLTAVFAIFAMAFVSCSSSDYEYDVTEPIAVNLRANITPQTTRVANGQWQQNDQVGLFMVRTGQSLSSASVFPNANNALMTVQGGVLTSNPPVMYPADSNVDFIAYYPFSSTVGSNFTIPINAGNQSAGLPTEVLFSNNITNQAPTTNAVTLNFLYSLAKLNITVTAGAGSTRSAVDFDNMSVSIEGMYTQADLQLTNGTFTNHRERQAFTLYNTGNTATSASFAALVLPSGGSEEITFLFDVGGVVYRHTMTVDKAAANLYRLNFALDPPSFPEPMATLLNAVIIPRTEHTQNFLLNDWPISVKINGIRWATRNVDMPGTFAENPWDAGMFFQWNRRVGWSGTDPLVNSDGGTVWNGTIPDGTAWYPENDPCPTGWRVPTVTEFQSLNSAGSIWTSNWNGTGVAGRLYGIAPNQIFLPAARARSGSNGAIWATLNGNYWSSTTQTQGGALDLWFGSGHSHPGDSVVRVNGYSVRCVAE